MTRFACFLLVFAIGCGGQIATDPDAAATGGVDSGVVPKGDGGLAKDGSIKPPPPDGSVVTCDPGTGSGTTDPNGNCTITNDWTCGADKYSVSCTCPTSICKCVKNGVASPAVKYAGCPGCSTSMLGVFCGFPQ